MIKKLYTLILGCPGTAEREASELSSTTFQQAYLSVFTCTRHHSASPPLKGKDWLTPVVLREERTEWLAPLATLSLSFRFWCHTYLLGVLGSPDPSTR